LLLLLLLACLAAIAAVTMDVILAATADGAVERRSAVVPAVRRNRSDPVPLSLLLLATPLVLLLLAIMGLLADTTVSFRVFLNFFALAVDTILGTTNHCID
jgi:hypothetical protein